MKTIAGILIGGASRRMGRPKALLTIGGQTLLERTVAVAQAALKGLHAPPEVVLLGRPLFDLPVSLRQLEIIEDRHPGIGPLGGLDAAFAARAACSILLLACDLPAITGPFLARLLPAEPARAGTGGGIDAVVFATAPPPMGWEPCCAWYRPSCRAVIGAQIAAGQYAMINLLSRVRVLTLHLSAHEQRQLRNVNAPSEQPSDT